VASKEERKKILHLKVFFWKKVGFFLHAALLKIKKLWDLLIPELMLNKYLP